MYYCMCYVSFYVCRIQYLPSEEISLQPLKQILLAMLNHFGKLTIYCTASPLVSLISASQDLNYTTELSGLLTAAALQ